MSSYFEDQINTGQPIVPPTPVQAPSTVPATESASLPDVVGASTSNPQGLPVRAEGDKIWLLGNGVRRWITTAEVYEKLGFKFGDEGRIDQETLNVIPEGEAIR